MKKIKFISLLFVLGLSIFCFYACQEDLKKSDYDFSKDPSKLMEEVQIVNITNTGYTASVVVNLDLNLNEEGELYDLGVIASTEQDFTVMDSVGIVMNSLDRKLIKNGENQIKIENLKLNTKYYYQVFTYNKHGLYLTEKMDFETKEIPEFLSPYITDFTIPEGSDSISSPKRAGWDLAGFQGFGEDLVIWFDMEKAGDQASGYAMGTYINTETPVALKIVSPQILITNEKDSLSFKTLTGVFGHPYKGMKLKVSATEDLDTPGTTLKEFEKLAGPKAIAPISLKEFHNKKIYIILEVIDGDGLIYSFKIDPHEKAKE